MVASSTTADAFVGLRVDVLVGLLLGLLVRRGEDFDDGRAAGGDAGTMTFICFSVVISVGSSRTMARSQVPFQ